MIYIFYISIYIQRYSLLFAAVVGAVGAGTVAVGAVANTGL